jgi:AcrR family transcriptional regulator
MSRAKSARTRNQVIEGALRALSSSGVLATTTREIAAESNVPLSVLHYHFDSKSALLLAVFEHLIAETTQALRVDVNEITDVTTCIEQLLRVTWRFVTRTREQQIIQYELTLYALREGAEWLAEQQYDAFVKVYQNILVEIAKRTAELNSSDCAAVARFMVAGIDGLLLQELAKPNRSRSLKGLDALIQSSQAYAATLTKESQPRARANDERSAV